MQREIVKLIEVDPDEVVQVQRLEVVLWEKIGQGQLFTTLTSVDILHNSVTFLT